MTAPRTDSRVRRQRRLLARLRQLWAEHDACEREILLVERKLPDRVLRRIGAAAAP